MRTCFDSLMLARFAGAIAVAAVSLWGPAVLADGAADAIAGKFADDASEEAQAEQGSEAKWLHEEARRAVERALSQEEEEEREQNAPGQGEVETSQTPQSEPRTAVPQPEAEPSEAVDQSAAPAPSEDQQLEADDARREAEAKELSDKLRAVRRKHELEKAKSPETERNAGDDGVANEVVTGLATQAAGYISPLVEKQVSILIVLDVGKTGVRRWSKTADPMLCVHENCYLSRGAGRTAEKLTRSAAFGPSVALGKRGQACRSKPACIFRNINLETVEAKLQPVDLRFVRHDRREARPIRADTTCAIIDGELSCRSPVEGKTWRAWIVPESVAKRVGAKGLEAAMANGLK